MANDIAGVGGAPTVSAPSTESAAYTQAISAFTAQIAGSVFAEILSTILKDG